MSKSRLYICKEYETPFEQGYGFISTVEDHNKMIIEKIQDWCTEQSRILKKEWEKFDSEECFGGYRAFEDMIRYLDDLKNEGESI